MMRFKKSIKIAFKSVAKLVKEIRKWNYLFQPSIAVMWYLYQHWI